MLLAFDSSAGTAVAVVDGVGEAVAARASTDPRAHAESIGPLIAGVLADAGLEPRDVTAVAFGTGPGPFTGLRVGIAAARTFAQARGVPALGVLSHDAIAIGQPRDGRVVVVTDAKRREVYWSVYDGIDAAGLPRRVEGPFVGGEGEVPESPRILGVPEAAAIGRIAAVRLRHGLPPESPEPRYLRSPDVTLAPAKGVTG